MIVMPIVISEPAPRPCSIRKAISCTMPWASPDSAEPTRKIASPPRKTRRRPSRSDSRPHSGIVTVEVSRKPENTQE